MENTQSIDVAPAPKIRPKPLAFRTAEVLSRRLITPGMVRVTLGGDGLKTLESTGIGDEYIRLFFPDPITGELVLPQIDERGHWSYPEGKTPAHCECYTIRAVRPGEIDLDFVVHDHGRASEWAQSAMPGDRITMREPHAIYEAPAGLDWLLLVADATGLPAIGRLLESLSSSVEARVILEVPHRTHEQIFDTKAQLKQVWLHGSGNGLSRSRLAEAVRSVTVPKSGKPYVWVPGEMKEVRAIRRYLRHDLGLDRTRYSVTGYWTDKQEEWSAHWDALDPAVRQQLDDLWESGRDSEDITDEVEATMEKFGL